ncbi:hypothetical protein CYMTET_37508 [Cymbomonas tetramitiformis]|uniref:Uncharacterized protein n=1 Tax=Cymbomonas tetramitiformis TaxID=36881 RepID=A0AAE0CDR9_9CHLO|nr:hypothetical protein CYMTET_37508 [Cymbomonas tetramitiformis]
MGETDYDYDYGESPCESINGTIFCNSNNFTGVLNVCTSPWRPMVSCGDTREEYSGYEIELWKMGVKDFTQGDDSAFPYEFTCWPWTAMLEEAVSPDTVCDFVVAGVSRLGDMEDSEDVQWSWTTYRSGFSILTLEQSQQSTDYFSMFAPFDFHVWLLFISTSAFMGVLIWLADFILGNFFASNFLKTAPARTTL